MLAALAMRVPLVAQSDTPPAAPTDASQEVVQLPEFTVRAEKDTSYVGKSALSSTRVAVDIAELPQSVQVLNSSFLKAVNPFMLTDILNYTGGAQNGQLNWTSGRLNIRGFTGEGDYNDGFAPPSASTVDSSIYERFEVIKGPSTVFLAADGSPGGVVNKITKSAISTPSTTLKLQTGLFDGNHVDLDSTGRLTKDGKLLYRVVAAMQYSDGYYDNTYMHRLTTMPMFSYQFTPDTKIEIKGLVVETNFPAYNGLPIDPRTHQIFAVPATRSQSEDAPANWRHDAVNRVWMNFTSRLNEYVALRIAAMNAYDRADRVESLAATWNEGSRTWVGSLATYNGTGLIPRTTTADDATGRYRDLQSDVNFNFKTGPAAHSLLVGGELRDNPSGTISYAGTSSGWDPFNQTTPVVTVNYAAKSAWTQNTSTTARVYVLETAKLFDERLLLSYGVSRARGTASTQNMLTGAFSTPDYVLNKNLKQYGMVFKIVPGVNVFTGYNENFALNGTGLRNGVTGPLPPKLGKQSEVGLKLVLLNKKLTANISYFDIKQENNQVPSAPLDPLNPYVLVPGVISRGFDGDLSYQVNPSFYLMGSFAWYNAKSVLGPQSQTYVQPYYGQIVTGSIPVDNTAQHTSSLFGLYRFTAGSLKGLSFGLGYNYLSKRAVTDGPNQVMWSYLPGRLLLNSNITYRVNQHLSYGLNLDNILNKKYIYSVRSENVIVPGQAFNAKFSVEYTF
jgi:iron complex outermembrane receptor protein